MGLIDRWRRWAGVNDISRADDPLSFDQWATFFSYLGQTYGAQVNTTLGTNEQTIEPGLVGFANATYRGNPVVFACIAVRMRVFSEARFQWQHLRGGRPTDLWGSPALGLLERPWPGGSTGDLLAHALLSADLAGNAFIYRDRDRLQVLRPDWVTIATGIPRNRDAGPWSLGAELVGYLYHPGGKSSGQRPIALGPDQVAHFAPIPDPFYPNKGMSWLSPLVREVQADSSATTHKQQFFGNAATPNLKVHSFPTRRSSDLGKSVV